MQSNFILEICVESVDCAIAAERAKAHRIELCTDLASGGITPSAGMMQAARKHVRLPIHVLIRPRAGDFCYSPRELETMRNDVQMAKQLGMDGVVFGILNAKKRVDVEGTRKLVELARPLPVTFHRAFDSSSNLEEALEAVVQTGAERILTSGRQAYAADALSCLARLVRAAQDRIVIMPGGGITATNIVRIARATSAREIHTSVGASTRGNGRPALDGRSCRPAAFEKKVRRLTILLGNFAANGNKQRPA